MYKEIIVETTSEGAEIVADTFFSIGASGVTIDDPNDIKEVLADPKTWDYVDEHLLENQDRETKVSCFVSEEECDAKIAEIKEELKFYNGIDFGSLKFSTKDYVDGDWLKEWKKYYNIIHSGKYVIVPEWMSYTPTSEEVMIKIDPSMAFGTGEHESTKLCLKIMSDLEFVDKHVIDVGTGSGILGIAARKSGSKDVYMCDIDSLSIKSAHDNAELNNIVDGITIEESDLCSKTDKVADVMLANLTADILIRLSASLPEHLKNGGYIVCSGIIHSRLDEVVKTFENLGLKLIRSEIMGEWDGVCFQK